MLTPQIESYFRAERVWASGFAVVGLAIALFAGYLWFSSPTWRGAALPLALFALVEMGIGVSVAAKAPTQMATLVQKARAGESLSEERARVEGVMRTFSIVKAAELVLIVVGVGLIYGLREKPFAVALGLGLVVQCAGVFAFDVVASRRAADYQRAITAAP